jgi:hypothetical protein
MASRGGSAKGDHFARRAQEICASHVGKLRSGTRASQAVIPGHRISGEPGIQRASQVLLDSGFALTRAPE